MKFIFTFLLTVLFSSAHAEGQFIGAFYDYDLANSNNKHVQSAQKRGIQLGQSTSIGAFDVTAYENAKNGKVDDTYQAVELGYGNRVSVGNFRLRGRFSFGHIENGPLYDGAHHSNYMQFTPELGYQVTPALVATIAVRHRFSGDLPSSDKYVFGMQYMLNTHTQLRLGFTHTKSSGILYNGFTSGVFYQFYQF